MKSVFKKLRWGMVMLTLMAAVLLVGNCGLVWGSAAGPANDGWHNPTFEFSDELAVSQGWKDDESRVLAGDDGVYVISDYSRYINVWIDMKDLMAQKDLYYIEAIYTYYDNDGNEMRGDRSPTHTNSYISVSKSDWPNYYRHSVVLDINAKITAVKYNIYNVKQGDWGRANADGDPLKSFEVKFTYADYENGKVPSYELVGVSQAGREIEPSKGIDFYGKDCMTFNVNSAEDYEYRIVGHNLLEGETYTINQATETMYTKDELEQGVTVKAWAGSYNGGSRYSNYGAVFGLNYVGLKYQGDTAQISVSDNLNNDVPKYDICIKYKNSDECTKTSNYTSGVLPYSNSTVDVDNYDPESNPLVLYVKGEDYDISAGYTVKVNIRYLGNLVMSDHFEATGAELNSGVSKNYFNDLNYVKFDQLFDGTFVEGGIEIETEIGNTTRYVDFTFNGGATMGGVMFTSDGLTFGSYEYGPYGSVIPINAGNKFVEGYETTSTQRVFGSYAYVQTGVTSGNADGANYHIYYHTKDKNINDLSGATLLKEGTVGAGGGVGLVRVDDADGYYTVVLERNGRIIDVAHFGVSLEDYETTVGFMPVLRSEVEGALSNDMFSYGYGMYKMHEESSVEVVAYGAGMKDTDVYNLEIAASSGFSDSRTVTGAELNGETVLFAVPYDKLFDSNLGSSSIYLYIRDMDGNLLASKGCYISISTEVADATANSVESTAAAIRELESEQKDERVENAAAGVADVQIDGNTMSVTAEKACTVIGRKDGEYVRVTVNTAKEVSDVSDSTVAHKYNIAGFDKIYVMLTGDVDMNGEVNSFDSALINYSLPSVTGSRHKDITDELMLLMADVDKNGEINSFDSALINYSLPSVTGSRHKELAW